MTNIHPHLTYYTLFPKNCNSNDAVGFALTTGVKCTDGRKGQKRAHTSAKAEYL